MELLIPAGGMYQEWNCLIYLLEQDKAKELELLAADGGWREILPADASDMGFTEQVDCAVTEIDALVLINDNYLVHIPRQLYYPAKC